MSLQLGVIELFSWALLLFTYDYHVEYPFQIDQRNSPFPLSICGFLAKVLRRR